MARTIARRTAIPTRNGAQQRGAQTPRFNPYQNPTPQAKMLAVNKQFGVKGMKNQQGSTLIFNDTLLLTEGLNPEGTTLTFFLNAKIREFPFTNLLDGKLLVGESIALERAYFYVVTEVAATGEILAVQSPDAFAIDGFYFGTLNMLISNQQVIKPIPLLSVKSEFNRYASYADYQVLHFETDIIIPQLLEFQLNVKLPAITIPTSVANNYYLGCCIEGHASILASRSTY